MEIKFLAKQTTSYGTTPHPWPFTAGAVVTKPEKLIVLAGQVGYDRVGADRKLIGPGDPAAQTRQAIKNMKRLLAAEGATLADIVHMTVYLVDVASFAACGKVAQEYFGDPPPPMTLIGCKALAWPELLVEIQAMAMVKA
jgi:enamine deaminase RidA (YjgF/YER057c/UK114 family)